MWYFEIKISTELAARQIDDAIINTGKNTLTGQFNTNAQKKA
jgi:hypothetical protein